MNKQFFVDNFGQTSIIEHYASFFKFKIFNSDLLSNVFGKLEQNKEKL